MAVWNLGSINEDRFYRVPHLPGPGETLTAVDFSVGLGGKGANQSVAAARAGAKVHHIGRVGPEGAWARKRLAALGVDVTHIAQISGPTGHANVHVDDHGENMIVIFAGANRTFEMDEIERALGHAQTGDIFMLQNETNLTAEAAQLAREFGLFVVYSAAPFELEPAMAVLPFVDLLVLNTVEAEQLAESMGQMADELPVPNLLITRGAHGAIWYDHVAGEVFEVPAFRVTPVDTTGAGDCFTGYVVAGLDQGLAPADAMRLGSAAAALQVTRPGTSEAIPDRAETDTFLAEIDG